MTARLLILAGSLCFAAPAFAADAWVTIASDPPGASIYWMSPGPIDQHEIAFGPAPQTIKIQVPKNGCVDTHAVRVRWVSGEEASLASLHVCRDSPGREPVMFLRPSGAPGLEDDTRYARDRARLQTSIAVFIGPQTHEGFTDVDRGILDSIDDLHGQFRHASAFTVVSTPDAADLLVLVVGRRTAGAAGAVGVPVGTMAVFVPIKRRAIDTVLRVGTYDKALTSTGDHETWTSAAQAVVKDVEAWVTANREGLARRSQR